MKKLKQKYRCIEELKYGNCKTTGCPTKTFGHDRRCGFTLVELVIVIAIVIILSVISVPIYRSYVDKAKFSEAYALLGTVLSAQKAYYSEHGYFFRSVAAGINATYDQNATCYEPVLGVDARGNKYFTTFSNHWGIGDPKDFFVSGTKKPEDLTYNQYKWFSIRYSTTAGGKFQEENF